jgi:hypothetical protein
VTLRKKLSDAGIVFFQKIKRVLTPKVEPNRFIRQNKMKKCPPQYFNDFYLKKMILNFQ